MSNELDVPNKNLVNKKRDWVIAKTRVTINQVDDKSTTFYGVIKKVDVFLDNKQNEASCSIDSP